MALTVVDYDFPEIEGRHPLQAGDVYSQLTGVRTALVVRVDTADSAEVMLGRLGIEAVGREPVLTFGHPETLGGRRHRHRAAHPADAASASPR